MTVSPATLLALASEVEAGEGPDRELDARIARAITGRSLVQFGDDVETWRIEAWAEVTGLPAYTASVDAAIALMDAVLPRHRRFMVDPAGYGPGAMVQIYDIHVHGGRQIAASTAPTLPRAIVAAVLRGVAATITPQEK